MCLSEPQPDDVRVAPEDACPLCGERNADRLVWDEDGERVTCSVCGTVYKPGGEAA